MSFAGTVLDMIKRTKANRAMQRGGNYFKSNKIGKSKCSNELVFNKEKFKVTTDAEKLKIRDEVRQQIKAETTSRIIKTIAVLFILLFTLLFLTQQSNSQ